MRVTRAAQRAQQDVEKPVEALEASERVLQDIEPNASPSAQAEEPLPAKTPAKTPAKKGKGKGAKKGAKGKKVKAEEEGNTQTADEDESQATTGPVHEDAEQGLSREKTDEVPEIPSNEEESKAPQTPALRLTRRQLAKLEEEALGQSQRGPPPQREKDAIENAVEELVEQLSEEAAVEVNKDVDGKNETSAPQAPAKVESEPAPKPVRLTRRQQAKLEEELKQSQREQEVAPQEPTEEEVLEEIVAEAQAEAVAEQDEQAHDEITTDEIDKLEERVIPTTASKEQNDLLESTEPQQEEVEIEAPEVIQAAVTQIPEDTEVEDVPSNTADAEPAAAITEAQVEVQFETPVIEEFTPSVEITSEPEPRMLSAEKPFEESISTPDKGHTPIRRASRSPSKSPMRIEESISAIDRLEEDLEDIGKAIPDLDHSDDEKSPRKPRFVKTAATPTAKGKTPSKTPAKTSAKTPAKSPAKAASKTPSKAPIKAPVAARAPPPTRISRVPSAAPKSVKPTTSLLARASSVRTAPSKDVRKASTDTADYLASKRRPISVSFPTPPPPPKGRAPTKPTFQLSSDAVTAKLKVQKEERLKREAEGAPAPKQRPISMPPPPKSTKAPTVPSFQLPGEAVAAKLKAQREERVKREAEGAEKSTTRPISMHAPAKSMKQLTKPSFQLPGEATAARLKAQKEERLKRMEEAEAAKKAALTAPVRKPIAHRPRESFLSKDQPGISIPPPSQLQAPQRSSSLASKRSSIVGPSASRSTSTSSANRNSLLLAAGAKSTVTLVDAAALKVKGKQVFNRDKMGKEERERERREKEEAAKKARAEAAERGRIASREWAERQRKKMLGQ